ncbi:MAG: hypothetical protein KAG34_07975 [Cocleimonas sp.]|nr:hypothetical protein [Cocleimonas sp.]
MNFHKKNGTRRMRFNGKQYALLRLKNNLGMGLSDDLPLHVISSLRGFNLPRDIQMTSEATEQIKYEYLEYVHLLRTNDELNVTVEVNYPLQVWKEKINLLSYLETLREQLRDNYSIQSAQNNLFDEALISVRFQLKANCTTHIKSMIELLDNLLYQEHKRILSYQSMKYKISLSRRHQQAGKSLLHYLYRVMEHKNLSDDLTVSVSEAAHLVTLELRFPRSRKKKIREAIHYYGLILKGDLSTSHLFHEKGHCADLSTTLGSVQKRITAQNEMLYETTIEFHSAEEETVWLREHIGNCLADDALIAA